MQLVWVVWFGLVSLGAAYPTTDDEHESDLSRKLLGSSVVTSVSVIMEHGNGSKTVIRDPGTAASHIVGTPGSLLSPDRYEFYTFDDSGDLVKRLMSLEEIQSLIAAGSSRPEIPPAPIPVYYHRPLVEPDFNDDGVQGVLASVQSVLKEELAKEREPPKPQPLPQDDSWSLLLPGLFGSDLDFKTDPILKVPEPEETTTERIKVETPPTMRPPWVPHPSPPSYVNPPHEGTTFGVLPPLSHPLPTTAQTLTTKPVKYSAHYSTTLKPPSTTVQTTTEKQIPSGLPTIIHYLPIQSISPSTIQHKPTESRIKVDVTTIPPKKTTLPSKPTTKPTFKPENKTEKAPIKPTTMRPSTFSTFRTTVRPQTQPSRSTQRPTTVYKYPPSSTRLTTTSAKPVTEFPTKPDRYRPPVNQKPSGGFLITEAPGKIPVAAESYQRPVNVKHPESKPSLVTSTKPPTVTKPNPFLTSTVRQPPPNYNKPPSFYNYDLVHTINKASSPSPPSTTKKLPSSRPSITTTTVPTTPTTVGTTESIEYVALKEEEAMASSAAALIQDLLKTEPDLEYLTKPTTIVTTQRASTQPSPTTTPRAQTTRKPTTHKKPSAKPASSQTVPTTNRTKPTTERPKTTVKIATSSRLPTKPTTYITKKPSTATRPSVSIATQQTLKPASSNQAFVAEKLTDIQKEALVQTKRPSKPTKPINKRPITVVELPIENLKVHDALLTSTTIRNDVKGTTTKRPSVKPTKKIVTTTTTETTESVQTTTNLPSTLPSELPVMPDRDMINQVIATLQSEPNRIVPSELITNTPRVVETTVPISTESTTNSAVYEKLTTYDHTATTGSFTEAIQSSTMKVLETLKSALSQTKDPDEVKPQSSNVSPVSKRPYTKPTSSGKPQKLNSKKPSFSTTVPTRTKKPVPSTLTTMPITTVTTEAVPSTIPSTTVEPTTEEISSTAIDNQETTTGLFADEAIQEGISAVANLLLEDIKRLPLGSPFPTVDRSTLSQFTESYSTSSFDATTEADMMKPEMRTEDGIDLMMFSTTEEIPTTKQTEQYSETTTFTHDVAASEMRQSDDVELNDTIQTTTVTTEKIETTTVDDSPTSKVAGKLPVDKIPSLVPTKESKIVPSEALKLEQPQVPPKSNITQQTSKYTSSTTKKPTSTTTATTKSETKNNIDTNKYFKKPGINSYQPNGQQPASIDLHPAPHESMGLEASVAFLGEDVRKFSDLLNELGFRLWSTVSGKGQISSRSLVLSPFAATSMLSMVFLGARGPTSGQMNDVLRLDDMVTFNPHQVLRNVTESVINSKNYGVATAAFVRELYSEKTKGRILDFYKERVHQYYDGHVEEVNFNNIGDVVRRRTNLLVKRQTLGKIPEYLRGSSLNLRAPLAAFTANIFQTDCELGSTDGRDGEMYFVVRPSTRQRRLVPVPAVVWRSNFLAGYEPSLDATSVCLGADSVVSTLLILPGQQGQVAPGDGLARLEQRLIEASYRRGAWSRLLRSLLPRPGLELQVPRFSHRSVLNITSALRNMGLKDLFTTRADLRGLNGVSRDLHLSDMVQVNTFSTCGEEKVGARHHTETYPASPRPGRSDEAVPQPQTQNVPPQQESAESPVRYARYWGEDWLHRSARLPDVARLRFDRPFLYMVRHNPTGIILHMGRFNPRLLP